MEGSVGDLRTFPASCEMNFFFFGCAVQLEGFPGGSEDKVSACNAGDLGLIPGLGRSPGEGNGNPLQYSCLENPMDRGAWRATVHGVAKSRTQLSNFTFTFFHFHGLRDLRSPDQGLSPGLVSQSTES